jgi:polyisoprenoid-binding protein YceI
MRRTLLPLVLFIATPLATVGAQSSTGQAITLHFEPASSQISYTAGGALHHVKGKFALKGGLIAFDPATGIAQGQILVDAESGHSNDKKLDAKMQKEVLESGKYPEIFFHPEKSTGTLKEGSEEQLALIGSFNIHGSDHPLKVNTLATLHGSDATVKADFDVPYVEWGMKDESTLLMRDKKVHIAVLLHATVEGANGEK